MSVAASNSFAPDGESIGNMTNLIQKLLELDEANRQETLANLGSYAEAPRSQSAGKSVSSRTSTVAKSAGSMSSGESPESAEDSQDSYSGSGSESNSGRSPQLGWPPRSSKAQTSPSRYPTLGGNATFDPGAMPFVSAGYAPTPVSGLVQMPPGLHDIDTGSYSALPKAPEWNRNWAVPAAAAQPEGSAHALRMLLGNLIASLPPGGAPIAKELLEAVRNQGGTNLQQATASIQVLRWLKAAMEGNSMAGMERPDLVQNNPSAPPQAYPANMAAANLAKRQLQPRTPAPAPPGLLAPATTFKNPMRGGYAGPQWMQPVQQPPKQQHPLKPQPSPKQKLPAKRAPVKNSAVDDEAAAQRPLSQREARASPPSIEHAGTLRSHLRDLQNVNISHIFLVRKINQLGFEAASLLKSHFSQYGVVDRVLVAHSHVKSAIGRAPRLRPSGLGFIVMTNAADVEKVLSQGEEQRVHSTAVRVHKFEHRMDDDDGLDAVAGG